MTTRLTEVHVDVTLQRIKPAILKEIQARFGKPLGALLRSEETQADGIWALAYAEGRRLDPELTWEEVGELDVYLESAPVPPTNGAGSEMKRRSQRASG